MLLLISAVTYTGGHTQVMNVTHLFLINENIKFCMMTNTMHLMLR